MSLANKMEIEVLIIIDSFVEDLIDKYSLVFDFAKYFCNDLEILFTNFEAKDEKVRQLYIDFIAIIKLFDCIIGPGKYIYMPNTGNKRTPLKILYDLYARLGVMKKVDTILEKLAEFDDILVRQGVIKCYDYC